MRSLLLVGLLSTCQALLLQPTIHARAGGLTMGAAINESIDKENPKVVNVLKVSEFPKLNLPRGKKAVYCRCWKSGTFPLCDAAHVKHNKETGDNVGPLILDNDAYECSVDEECLIDEGDAK